MLRRLLSSVFVTMLAASIAVPYPAVAGIGRCTMDEPVLAAAPCSCCDAPAAAGSGSCTSACGCALRADPGSDTTPAVASAPVANVVFAVDAALVPASLSTPSGDLRRTALASSPPGAGATVSRPMICSWTI
jgi:hypothetical protein